MAVAPTKAELKDLGWRSFWTFIQAFTGIGVALIAALGSGTVDASALSTAVIVGVGAGVAAVFSLIKTFASNRLGSGTTVVTAPPAVAPEPEPVPAGRLL